MTHGQQYGQFEDHPTRGIGTASTTGSPAIQSSDSHHDVRAVIEIGVDCGTRRPRRLHPRTKESEVVDALREVGLDDEVHTIGGLGHIKDASQPHTDRIAALPYLLLAASSIPRVSAEPRFGDATRHDARTNTHLPGAEHQAPFFHGNGKLRQSKCRANVRRHIVRTFAGMPVQSIVFRRNAVEEGVQVVLHVRVGIFLNREGRRSMLHEHRQQSGPDIAIAQPACDRPCNLVQSLAVRVDLQAMRKLLECPATQR